MKRRAIVSGAGIAGLSAAWWLRRSGWEVVVVEKSPDIRDGGYLIGLSGPGLDVARRMGLGEQLTALSHRYDENVYRDSAGRELLKINYGSVLGNFDYLVLRRADLVGALHEISGDIEIRHGVTWVAQEEGEDGIAVALSDGSSLTAEVLIGAEGLRSPLRRLIAPDTDALQQLGYRFAAYESAGVFDSEHAYLTYVQPGCFSGYYRLGQAGTACLHIWRSPLSGAVPAEERWPLLDELLRSSHPAVRAGLAVSRLGQPPVLDDLAIAVLPRWSKGRICLVGDAAHGLTLMSGQGAGMAMASALVLAQELSAGSLAAAQARHRERMTPVIRRLQERSRRMARWFIPESRLGLSLRMAAMRHLPRPLLRRHLLSAAQSELRLAQGFIDKRI